MAGNIVKTISSIIDGGKRFIKVLRFGQDDVQESHQISPHGIDSNPVKDMVALYMQTAEKGKTVIVGYVNPNQISEVGELRLYATDSDGVEKNSIHLKNDGTIEVGGDADFMVRFGPLQTGFNKLKSDHDNFISGYNIHVHPTAPAGPVSVPSVLGLPSTADISGAKIDEIKTSS